MRPGNDEEVLIPGRDPFSHANSIFLYMFTKLAALSTFALLCLLALKGVTISVVSVVLLFVDFWFTQNIHGLQLVGLRWWYEFGSGFQYYSKPDPFVPLIGASNIFWMGFFVFTVIWIFTFVVSIFTSGFLIALNALLAVALQILNLSMFMRAHRTAKAVAERAALNILQGESINFELVREDEPTQIAPAETEPKKSDDEIV
jgi:hypothetical protein